MKKILFIGWIFWVAIIIFCVLSRNSYSEFSYVKSDSGPQESQKSLIIIQPTINYCDDNTIFADEDDKKYCFTSPYLIKDRGVEINLTTNKVTLYDKGKLIKTLDLLYQSPENVWMESPTGLFKIGTKEKLHWSTIGLVWMPYSMQYYEDFFLHGIPYRPNGNLINSMVSGGCLRFEDKVAKQIYDFVKIQDPVLVFASYNSLPLNDGFSSPLNMDESFILQRFYNPLRIARRFSGDRQNLKLDYYNHTGVDLKLKPGATDKNVYAIKDGVVSKIVYLGKEEDYGMGNTIIIKHQINGKTIYSLYAHLSKIKEGLKEGSEIKGGESLGEIGSSGFGCEHYWRLNKNGCEGTDEINDNLHLEMKTKPVLYNPIGGKVCLNKNNQQDFCYRYAPDPLLSKGYLNLLDLIFKK